MPRAAGRGRAYSNERVMRARVSSPRTPSGVAASSAAATSGADAVFSRRVVQSGFVAPASLPLRVGPVALPTPPGA